MLLNCTVASECKKEKKKQWGTVERVAQTTRKTRKSSLGTPGEARCAGDEQNHEVPARGPGGHYVGAAGEAGRAKEEGPER